MSDLISRQAAIDVLRECQTYLFDSKDPDKKIELRSAEQAIDDLPAVQPDHTADIGKKVSISCGQENDLISRQAAIDALARMMPHSYTPDGSHPADEEIFRAQEVFADCIEALEILPSAQPEQRWIPIKNRLPAVPQCRCLITRDDGRERATVEEALFSFGRWYSNEWLEDGRNREFNISASVIAWAPFPAPYRGGEE